MQAFLDENLSCCDEFIISVAFITDSGLASFKQTFRELENRGIKGKILTTDYLTFTEPKALAFLAKNKNIELRLFQCGNGCGLHTKGYLFSKNDLVTIAIGSSNLTARALSENKEWNVSYSVKGQESALYKSVMSDFDALWNSPNTIVVTEDYIEEYRNIWIEVDEIKKVAHEKRIKLQNKSAEQNVHKDSLSRLPQPNSMQTEFTKKVNDLRALGESKALLISATGTGKTYASAFALRDFNPKRALFLVHREGIARKSKMSFQNVFGNTKTFGEYTGNSKEAANDFVFATMQTMALHYCDFKPDDFQVIVIDEAHHVGSDSYKKIMTYFKPNFWIGMTATPERMDNFDVYAAFDHNIAHEIRLPEAMRLNLLCPFHYYGITDIYVDGTPMEKRDFSRLVADNRVNYIIKNAEYFGYSGKRLKGLVFCSSLEEAHELSAKFNKRGYRTVALSGNDSQDVREKAIEQLESDIWELHLDYIFTFDIFNEGVDIPQVNQVLLLRPTKSPIVFVQQLGRGLRKADNKEFVIVLDFIGNYDNNYMIPIALSGDKTYNKDNIRRYMREGVKALEGASTIHFDEISRKRIYEAIDSANFHEIKLIKECYQSLKHKLGRIPRLMDYEEYGELDVMLIFDNTSLGSYHTFLKKYEKELYHTTFSEVEEKYLKYISTKFANGKRPHELLILKQLLAHKANAVEEALASVRDQFKIPVSECTRKNIANILSGRFDVGTGKDTYSGICFIEQDHAGSFSIHPEFDNLLKNVEFFSQVNELVEFGLFRNQKYYGETHENTPFCLYEKYTYKDVFRLLDWEHGRSELNVGGYAYDKETNTYPIFINYDKSENVSASIRYNDRFVDDSTLIALSKSKRTLKSNDVQAALNADKNGTKIELFIRKNKDDPNSKEFYYMGRIHATGEANEILMPTTKTNVVEITYRLGTPVRRDIYDYIIS